MFSRIRRQLTILYTGLTALALGGFALLFYFGFAHLLMHEQERELEAYAVRELREVREVLKHRDRTRNETNREKNREFNVETAYVMFAVTSKGTIITPGNQEAALNLPSALLDNSTKAKRPMIYSIPGETESSRRFLWLRASIQEDGRERGVLFVGRDLSMYEHFLIFLSQALWGSTLVFLLVSGIVGYLAAGRAIAPIRRSFEAQRQFASDASHELRTPLSVIQASLDVVEKEDGKNLSGLSRQIVEDMKDEIRRMSRLVGNLLALARADVGELKLNVESFDVNPVVETVFRGMLPIAEAKGVNLARCCPANLALHADKDRITQLLMILVDNGIKFTPAGGQVTLTVERNSEGALCMEVTDTGIGLEPEERERIFERFYRVDKARSREEGGTGLGLSIASWIVSAHGGKIEVQGRPDGGSAFRVFLPSRL